MKLDQTHFRLARSGAKLARAVRARLGLKSTTYVQERVDEYRGYWETAAKLLGAEFVTLREDVWEVRRGGRRVRLATHQTPFDDPGTRRLAGDKEYCYRLAHEVGVPVPPHVVVRAGDLETARAFVGSNPPPYVVKPARDSASGLGVTTLVDDWRGVVHAAGLAANYDRRIIVERMAAGESHRLLFLGGELIHAVRRRGRRVVGDGRRTVAGLIETTSETAIERRSRQFTMEALRIDPRTVVPAGQEVLVSGMPGSSTTELRTVYDEAVTAECGEKLITELARVVEALGSEFAGIDIIANDLARPLRESGGTLLEINTSPGIHHHYLSPADHGPEPVAKLVLARLLGISRKE